MRIGLGLGLGFVESVELGRLGVVVRVRVRARVV